MLFHAQKQQTLLKLALLLFLALACPVRTGAQQALELWARNYATFGHAEDFGTVVAVDGTGNVIVAGSSNRGESGYDFVTIKHSASGAPIWTNRFSSPLQNGFAASENVTALAVANSGNIVVAGRSDAGPSLVVLNIASSGLPLWTNYFSNPANVDPSVAMDGQENVVVARGGMTIKYSNSGGLVWTNRNSLSGHVQVLTDPGNNVYVTGFSNLFSVTIAYSSSGTPLWTNRAANLVSGDVYLTPRAQLACDASSNVLVTAKGLLTNIVTLKYTSAGSLVWSNSFRIPGFRDASPSGIAVNPVNGNVYLTGQV